MLDALNSSVCAWMSAECLCSAWGVWRGSGVWAGCMKILCGAPNDVAVLVFGLLAHLFRGQTNCVGLGVETVLFGERRTEDGQICASVPDIRDSRSRLYPGIAAHHGLE
ncbi:hypothetical protein A8144_10530 [Mycobacterium leprae 3125609]|nr:hypothetical protein A8144_10530 [Mycobacterium leprae 3125609]OAX70752.1 hypothetical protein A3216_10115 [Mycobacterium leprae 7935681]